MRTTPALRTLTAALFTGGILAVPVGTATTATAATATTAATTMATAVAPGGSHGSDGSWIRGTVVSAGDLNLRQQPTSDSPVVGRLSPGSRGHVECSVVGQTVRGNPHWYWLPGVNGWASAAFIDTGGRSVPGCTDPCPEWKQWDHQDHQDHRDQWKDHGHRTL